MIYFYLCLNHDPFSQKQRDGIILYTKKNCDSKVNKKLVKKKKRKPSQLGNANRFSSKRYCKQYCVYWQICIALTNLVWLSRFLSI